MIYIFLGLKFINELKILFFLDRNIFLITYFVSILFWQNMQKKSIFRRNSHIMTIDNSKKSSTFAT
jgi:hypothetical protein